MIPRVRILSPAANSAFNARVVGTFTSTFTSTRSPLPGLVSNNSVAMRSYSYSRNIDIFGRGQLLERKKEASGKGKGKGKGNDEEESGSGSLDFPKISQQMEETLKKCNDELSSLKVGKADPSLLDKISVVVKGKPVPIRSVAQINIKDGSTLSVSVFEPSEIRNVQVAIRDAKLDLNPTLSGNVLLVPVPKPTKEFKDRLVKMAKDFCEHCRGEIRQVRRKTMDELKKLMLPEDDNRLAEAEVQRIQDKFMKQVDEVQKKKEVELSR